PSNPLSEQPLRVNATASDADGDAVTLSYRWSRNGALLAQYTGDVIPANVTHKSDVWAVTVTPNDGRMDGPSSTASVTISNTPPVVTSLRLTPLHPRTNDVLHAEATASDVDGTPVTFTYKWTRDGVLVSPPNGPDVAASLTTKGQVWNVTVRPDDGTDA